MILFNALIQETIAKLTDGADEDEDVEAFNFTSLCCTEDGKDCISPLYYSGKCTTHYSSSINVKAF